MEHLGKNGLICFMIHYYFFLYGPIFGQEMPGFTANMGGGVPQYMSFNETKKILAGGAAD